MWTFEHPFVLLLLLLLIPGIWLRHFRSRRGGTVTFAFSNWQGSRFSAPITWQGALNAVITGLFWMAFGCLIVALAGPAIVERERVFLSRGIDLMVVLDCSPSMAAQDYGNVSRLDHARDTIQSFLTGRENDPIGLVAFGAEAGLRIPPTLDYPAFLQGLEDVKVMEEGDGTAIGLGLSLAALHLKDSDAERKVIILLTDGENNAGEITPEVAANICQNLGIRVYAVGIGGNGAVPLEYVDPVSGKLYRGTYRGTLGDALLKDIATQTGGQYFPATSPGALEAVFQSIDSLEKVENRVRIDIKTLSLVDLFLLLAFCFILIETVVRRLILKELS